MIIDINAFSGFWPSHPVRGDVNSVRASLKEVGVERICISPLEAAWSRDPHLYNAALYRTAGTFPDLWPVPVMDPTVSTWREELKRATKEMRVKLVKLLPAYSPYALSDANDLLIALASEGMAAIVQTRLEDPRRQHPLSQVPDIEASEVTEVAARHPELTIVIGGPRTHEIRQIKDQLLSLPNLYADVSQSDGLDAVRTFIDEGLIDKLLFGSHAPLFLPYSAVTRITNDLTDEEATAILGENAERIIKW